MSTPCRLIQPSDTKAPINSEHKSSPPSAYWYEGYRHTSFGISFTRNAINTYDSVNNIDHQACGDYIDEHLCSGTGLQALSDTSIITSFLGLYVKIMQWEELCYALQQKVDLLNTLGEEEKRKGIVASIVRDLFELKQKFIWVLTAALYFLTYVTRGALMLAVTLGATAVLTVAGGYTSLAGSIVYAFFNVINTVVAFWQAYTDAHNPQGFFSLMFYDKKHNRSYMAEICGCSSILLSGLITLSLMGILSFPPVTLLALCAITTVFSVAYFAFWIWGKYSSKKQTVTKAATSTKELPQQATATDISTPILITSPKSTITTSISAPNLQGDQATVLPQPTTNITTSISTPNLPGSKERVSQQPTATITTSSSAPNLSEKQEIVLQQPTATISSPLLPGKKLQTNSHSGNNTVSTTSPTVLSETASLLTQPKKTTEAKGCSFWESFRITFFSKIIDQRLQAPTDLVAATIK